MKWGQQDTSRSSRETAALTATFAFVSVRTGSNTPIRHWRRGGVEAGLQQYKNTGGIAVGGRGFAGKRHISPISHPRPQIYRKCRSVACREKTLSKNQIEETERRQVPAVFLSV